MRTHSAVRRDWPRLAAIGVAIYAVCLVASVPASVGAWLIARSSAGRITLEGPEGTVWRGRAAALAIAEAGSGLQRVSGVTWRLSPGRLVLAQLALHASAEGGAARGQGVVVLAPQSLRFLDLALTSPASTLTALLPALQPVGMGGEIAVRSKDIVIGRKEVRGLAEIQWSDAATTLSRIAPLGTYRALVEGQGAAARFKVSTEKGALQVVGSGTWSPAEGMQFSGTAAPVPGSAAALDPLLRLLGPAGSGGAHPLKYSLTPR